MGGLWGCPGALNVPSHLGPWPVEARLLGGALLGSGAGGAEAWRPGRFWVRCSSWHWAPRGQEPLREKSGHSRVCFLLHWGEGQLVRPRGRQPSRSAGAQAPVRWPGSSCHLYSICPEQPAWRGQRPAELRAWGSCQAGWGCPGCEPLLLTTAARPGGSKGGVRNGVSGTWALRPGGTSLGGVQASSPGVRPVIPGHCHQIHHTCQGG